MRARPRDGDPGVKDAEELGVLLGIERLLPVHKVVAVLVEALRDLIAVCVEPLCERLKRRRRITVTRVLGNHPWEA